MSPRFSRRLQLKDGGDIVLRIRFAFENNGRVVFFAEGQFRFATRENSRKMKSVVLVHVKAICTSVREVALFKGRNENGCNDAVTEGETRYAEKPARSFLEDAYMKINVFLVRCRIVTWYRSDDGIGQGNPRCFQVSRTFYIILN